MHVTFFGDIDVKNENEILKWLVVVITKLIKQGVELFFCMGYSKFDFLAAKIIRTLKITYPNICSFIVMPFSEMPVNRDLYDYGFYSSTFAEHPGHAIAERDKYIAQACEIIVSGVTGDDAVYAEALKCAREKGNIIIQFPETDIKL